MSDAENLNLAEEIRLKLLDYRGGAGEANCEKNRAAWNRQTGSTGRRNLRMLGIDIE